MLVAEVCIYIFYFSRSRINILYSSATRRAWDVFYHIFRHQPNLTRMKVKFLLVLCDAKRNQSDLLVIFPFAWIWSHRENLMRTSGISTISVVPCWFCGFFVLFSTKLPILCAQSVNRMWLQWFKCIFAIVSIIFSINCTAGIDVQYYAINRCLATSKCGHCEVCMLHFL